LKKNVKNNKILSNRPPEVKDWIEEASWNLDLTINDASEDKNFIANRAGKAMKRLNS
jgi:IS30 family transposase